MEAQPHHIYFEEPAVETKRRIFISYKHHSEPEESLARCLVEHLSQDFEVTVEQNIAAPGQSFSEFPDANLQNTDYVIALLSPPAVQNSGVAAELRRAHEAWLSVGRPVIIPVRLNYTELWPAELAPYLQHFQALNWQDGEAQDALLQPLSFTLSAESAGEAAGDLSLLGPDLRPHKGRYVLINQAKTDHLRRLLTNGKPLWLLGDSRVTRYLALSLAQHFIVQGVYAPPNSLSWTQLNASGVSHSAIVLHDALPELHFSPQTTLAELNSLNELFKRQNIVIITSTPTAFTAAEAAISRWWESERDYYHRYIDRQFYPPRALLYLYGQMLRACYMPEDDRYRWGYDLLNAEHREGLPLPYRPAETTNPLRQDAQLLFYNLIKDYWQPDDVERFLTIHLSSARSNGEITTRLQRSAGLEQQIHEWFLGLDDSLRCFVLILALFTELEAQQLWQYYTEVVRYLRQFDPQLALWPLGVCRHRAAPYVTREGVVAFTEERVANAIRTEIATSYREYFVSLLNHLQEWTAPATAGTTPAKFSNDEDWNGEPEPVELVVEQTQILRLAAARMVGRAAQLRVNDVMPLLNHWAEDSRAQVREAAALALEQAAHSPVGALQALRLINRWGRQCTGPQTLPRLWTAATALGRIACVAATQNNEQALRTSLSYLTLLARDQRPRVAAHTALAVARLARQIEPHRLEPLLRQLAANPQQFVNSQTVLALNEALQRFPGSAFNVLRQWVNSTNEHTRRIAIYYLLTRHGPEQDQERRHMLSQVMAGDPRTFVAMLHELLPHYPGIEETLNDLAAVSRHELLAALAEAQETNPLAVKDLLMQFQHSAHLRLVNLAFEIRRAAWRALLPRPPELLHVLQEELQANKNSEETWRLIGDLIARRRHAFVASLGVSCVAEPDRFILVMEKLRKAGEPITPQLLFEIHAVALKSLLVHPRRFVQMLRADLSDRQRSAELLGTLRRREWSREWPTFYERDPEMAELMLWLFRIVGIRQFAILALNINIIILLGMTDEPVACLRKFRKAFRTPLERDELLLILEKLQAPRFNDKRQRLIEALAKAMGRRPSAFVRFLLSLCLSTDPALRRLGREIAASTFFKKKTAAVPELLLLSAALAAEPTPAQPELEIEAPPLTEELYMPDPSGFGTAAPLGYPEDGFVDIPFSPQDAEELAQEIDDEFEEVFQPRTTEPLNPL